MEATVSDMLVLNLSRSLQRKGKDSRVTRRRKGMVELRITINRCRQLQVGSKLVRLSCILPVRILFPFLTRLRFFQETKSTTVSTRIMISLSDLHQLLMRVRNVARLDEVRGRLMCLHVSLRRASYALDMDIPSVSACISSD